MDIYDRAQQLEAAERDHCIAQARRAVPTGESPVGCEHCTGLIEPARRLALPGVRTCIGCARAHELLTARSSPHA